MSTSMSARLSTKSKSNKATPAKEKTMATSSAKSRTIVFTLQGDNYASHYLAVRVEPEFRLSDQEKAGLLEIFDLTPSGAQRHNMYFKTWLPNVKEQMKGYAFYWLCDASLVKLSEVKEMVAEALQPAKAARKVREVATTTTKAAAPRSAKAEVKAKAQKAARAKVAARSAYAVVLG